MQDATIDSRARTARRPFEAPLLLAGVRCTVRYVVFPFVVPLTGAAGASLDIVTGTALGLLLILDVLAAISIAVTLRRLWRQRHPRRWPYLLVALPMVVLVGFFLVNDASVWYV